MATSTAVLAANGIANADTVVRAADAEGLPLWIAAAFIDAESNGHNIYGHDTGGTFYGAGAVTEGNYKEFYRLVVTNGGKSNGVGPMQITWKGFLTDAAGKGIRLWDPYENMRYGFKLVKGYLGGSTSREAIASAGTRYNGKDTYGAQVATSAATWETRLAGATPPPPPQGEDILMAVTQQQWDALALKVDAIHALLGSVDTEGDARWVVTTGRSSADTNRTLWDVQIDQRTEAAIAAQAEKLDALSGKLDLLLAVHEGGTTSG